MCEYTEVIGRLALKQRWKKPCICNLYRSDSVTSTWMRMLISRVKCAQLDTVSLGAGIYTAQLHAQSARRTLARTVHHPIVMLRDTNFILITSMVNHLNDCATLNLLGPGLSTHHVIDTRRSPYLYEATRIRTPLTSPSSSPHKASIRTQLTR